MSFCGNGNALELGVWCLISETLLYLLDMVCKNKGVGSQLKKAPFVAKRNSLLVNMPL